MLLPEPCTSADSSVPGPKPGIANLRLLERSHKGMESIKALEFATSKAAKVIGFGDKIGQLTKGYEADFILVNLDHPHLQPFYGTPSSLVWYARPEDVSDSFVRGRALMRDRKIINLDYHQAIQNVKQRTAHFADQMRSLGGVSNGPNCPCGYH